MPVERERQGAEQLRRGAWRARTLLGAMALVGAAAALVSTLLLYRAALAEQRMRLIELAHSQAKLIDAVARFDAVESRDANPFGAWVATLGQVADGFAGWHVQHPNVSFYVVGSQANRAVVYVENGRLLAPGEAPLPSGSPAELEQAIVHGEPISLQYFGPEGTTWLVVAEPIPALEMTVLARLDLQVVRRPLVQSALVSGGATVILIGLGVLLLRKTSVRLVDDLAHQLAGRIQAEAALARHRDDLERTVDARTAELRAAQRELVARERLATLGQITAKVSHELRNPLGTIRASLFTLSASAKKANLGVERVVERIERSVQRCDRIIEELLRYTRPRPNERESFDASTLLAELTGDYVPTAPVAVEHSIEPGIELFADREDIRRMVINLLNNAVDASAASQPAKSVRLALRRESGDVVIRVEDSGEGMSPEVQARAFEPLFSTKGFGVGLGLPIVRELCERNDGSVAIASRMGEGTVVTVRFRTSTIGAIA